ncbi:hypothetical protein GCM10011383_00810 [Hymenobacter cavernae]|uniref:Uncharacterized protein n=1 Tax=Hymenobacter cavernae TaxID=2044852 RepID=A0ABQ1TGG0_9BACT|nr:hypothetical protein GCM10011383_00810 [Hymenobacter cavernae]
MAFAAVTLAVVVGGVAASVACEAVDADGRVAVLVQANKAASARG